MAFPLNILTVFGFLTILYGLLFLIAPPKFNNLFYGIRTKLTSKNETVWSFGQKLFGYASMFIGLILIVVGFLKINSTKHGYLMALSMIALWFLAKSIVHKLILRKFPEI